MTLIRKITTHRTSSRRGPRDLARAISSAPTRASREELVQLQNMGR